MEYLMNVWKTLNGKRSNSAETCRAFCEILQAQILRGPAHDSSDSQFNTE